MFHELIRSTWLLRDLTGQEVSILATFAHKVIFQPGQKILEHGKKNDSLWILLRGGVGVLDASQKDFVARLYEGDLFGEMSWLDGHPASSTLQAIDSPTEVLKISFHDFDRFLNSHPDAHINILRKFAINLTHRLRSSPR